MITSKSKLIECIRQQNLYIECFKVKKNKLILFVHKMSKRLYSKYIFIDCFTAGGENKYNVASYLHKSN